MQRWHSYSYGALCLLVVSAVLMAGCTGAEQTRTAVPQETMTMDGLAGSVRDASAYAASAGEEAALAGFSNGNTSIFAYDYNGTLLACPSNEALVGTDRMNVTDVRGLPIIRIGACTASNGGGFVAFLDEAERGAYEPKIAYVYPVGETWWIGSEAYLADMAFEGSGAYPEAVSAMIDLVERGAAYGEANGAETAFAEISNRSGAFVDAEGHYLYAYDYSGTLLAHPYLGDKIGTSLIERRGPFGMENIRSLTETARDGGGFIVFVWPNPAQENREELKIGYVLPVDETWWVGSGVYVSEITGTDASIPAVR